MTVKKTVSVKEQDGKSIFCCQEDAGRPQPLARIWQTKTSTDMEKVKFLRI